MAVTENDSTLNPAFPAVSITAVVGIGRVAITVAQAADSDASCQSGADAKAASAETAPATEAAAMKTSTVEAATTMEAAAAVTEATGTSRGR